jgi:hypothetical protein
MLANRAYYAPMLEEEENALAELQEREVGSEIEQQEQEPDVAREPTGQPQN